MMTCPRCQRAFGARDVSPSGEVVCPRCHADLQVTFFPALFRDLGPGQTGERLAVCLGPEVRQRLRQAAQAAGPSGQFQPRLVLEGYKGFNVIQYGSRFYGLAQAEGAFEIQKVRHRAYRQCVEGPTVEAVKKRIDALLSRQPATGAAAPASP